MMLRNKAFSNLTVFKRRKDAIDADDLQALKFLYRCK